MDPELTRTMEILSEADIRTLIESLNYSKLNVSESKNYPDGPEGYKLRTEKLSELDAVAAKLRAMRDGNFSGHG